MHRTRTILLVVGIFLLVAVGAFWLGREVGQRGGPIEITLPTSVAATAAPPPAPATAAPDRPPRFGNRTKTAGCVARGGLPDPACTPGAIRPGVTVAEVCTPGSSSAVRNVTTAEKDRVYTEYGITKHPAGAYEIDHLISLELGGSNEIANLWPEAATPKPGFHEKDRVENYLHAEVCAGRMSLAEAQREIATDWIAVYRRIAP
jgi:hypothetical protein